MFCSHSTLVGPDLCPLTPSLTCTDPPTPHSHARSASSLQSRLEVLAGGERFVASVDGERRSADSVTISARVTSTLERLQRVEARLDHQRADRGITSSVVLVRDRERCCRWAG